VRAPGSVGGVSRPGPRSPTAHGDRCRATRAPRRLLAAGQLRPVVVPALELEALRDLVRAREDLRGDLMGSRHRVGKLLLRRG